MLKGILDGIVLEIIRRGEIYGYAIAKKLRVMGFEGVAEATVYALLLRLEKNKLVNITKKPSEIGLPGSFTRSMSGGLKNWHLFGQDGIF